MQLLRHPWHGCQNITVIDRLQTHVDVIEHTQEQAPTVLVLHPRNHTRLEKLYLARLVRWK